MDSQQHDHLSYNMSALFQGLLTAIEAEERRKAIETITRNSETPFPKTLRHALGRSLVECKAIKEDPDDEDLQVVDYRLRSFAEGVPIEGRALQQQMSARKKVVRMSVERVHKGVVKVLSKSRQEGLTKLFTQLVAVVQSKRLLRGFSSAAVIAGCMCFAAEVLDKELPLSRPAFRAHLEQAGLFIGRYATRAAYNTLWRQRRELEAVVAELGVRVDDLPAPQVAMKWEVHLDEESKRASEQAEEEL